MVIKNGRVLNDKFEFIDADIKTEGQRIAEIGSFEGEEILDATDCYVVPGFIDTHFHGALGRTFIDPVEDTFEVIAQYEAKNGVTAIVPALSAAPEKKLVERVKYMRDLTRIEQKGCAKVYGVHLEGPFFAEKFKGAHLSENIRNTDPVEFMKYVEEAEGTLKIITLAPELPNADEVIRLAVENGVVVSAGHCDATSEEIKHAVELGLSQGTHLFNAMSPLAHRAPGSVGGLLYTDAKVEIIGDFFHVLPDVFTLVYRLKGRDRINIITDSEVGTGLPPGDYEVNGRTLTVTDIITYTEDGTVAGSISNMHRCVKNLHSIGIPLEDISVMVSKNPAETAGIYDITGSIEEGKMADLVVLDKNMDIKHVVLRGELLY